MLKRFWIPSQDQSQVFKGLHSALVEAETHGQHRRRRGGFEISRGLRAALLAAGAVVVFVAGYWCGTSNSEPEATPPVAARTTPLPHDMLRSARGPTGLPQPTARSARPAPVAKDPAAARRPIQRSLMVQPD